MYSCSSALHSYCHHPTAPSSPPADLEVTSTTPTSFSIEWGDVPCTDRNSNITGYSGRYKLTESSYTVTAVSFNTMVGISNFTATGLIPRSNYTIEVEAVNINYTSMKFFIGVPSVITATTAVSQGELQPVVSLL